MLAKLRGDTLPDRRLPSATQTHRLSFLLFPTHTHTRNNNNNNNNTRWPHLLAGSQADRPPFMPSPWLTPPGNAVTAEHSAGKDPLSAVVWYYLRKNPNPQSACICLLTPPLPPAAAPSHTYTLSPALRPHSPAASATLMCRCQRTDGEALEEQRALSVWFGACSLGAFVTARV